MARLKLKEVLFPALVIDDEDAFSPMMRLLNNGNSRGAGFAATSKKNPCRRRRFSPVS